ncbi:MAG: hypothetical protein H0T62_14590 [Parachlamydiaceae bacterium]|nr:hypothetical protein [Parachlamydiaceae bacterium]
MNSRNHQMFKSICNELKSKLCIVLPNYTPTKKVVNKTTFKDADWTATSKGAEKILLMRGKGLDKTKDPHGKFSIEIKPIVYVSYPSPTSSKEVPIKIPNQDGWVLAKVNSLKWLDLTEDTIRKLSRCNADDIQSIDMSKLDLEIEKKLGEISKEIENGIKMKQQLADIYTESIGNQKYQIPNAIKLIDDIYISITSADSRIKSITFDSIKQMCEKTMVGRVGSENSVISILIIAATDSDHRKFGIVMNRFIEVANEKLNSLSKQEKSIANLKKISDIKDLKIMTSLDLIVAGRNLKEQCKKYENTVRGFDSAAEFSNIQYINRVDKFKHASEKCIKNIYEFVIHRENNMQSRFNIRSFETAMELAKKEVRDISTQELLRLVIKAVILEAANNYEDEKLGLIKNWFYSNDFKILLRSLSESPYVSSNLYSQENIFSTFMDALDEIAETELLNFSDDLDETNEDIEF